MRSRACTREHAVGPRHLGLHADSLHAVHGDRRRVEPAVAEFLLGSFLGRALKYLPIATLAYVLGLRVGEVLRRHGVLAAVAILALLILYFVLQALRAFSARVAGQRSLGIHAPSSS